MAPRAKSKQVCSVKECGKPVEARGWCSMHYHRWKKHGHPLGGRAPNGAALAFIEQAVSHRGDDCLVWPYTIGADGYGRVWIDGKPLLAHRVVCSEVHGPAPSDEHEAAHDYGGHPCTSRACVNGHHLRWATHADNEADKILHGSLPVGERNGFSKLTEDQVTQIYALRGKKDAEDIAEMFGVSGWTIRSIHEGKNWAWLTSQQEAC